MQNVNYDVLNTLNLMSPILGDAYLLRGYNPFEKDFAVSKKTVFNLLNNQKAKEKVPAPKFLENKQKSVVENFENALKVNTTLLNLPNLKREFLVFFKNRGELLKDAIEKLKNKDVNAFALYKEIYGLDPKLSGVLANSYFESFEMQNIINIFVNITLRTNKVKENFKEKSDLVL